MFQPTPFTRKLEKQGNWPKGITECFTKPLTTYHLSSGAVKDGKDCGHFIDHFGAHKLI